MDRRGFLRALGFGGVAAVVAPAALRASPALEEHAAAGVSRFEGTSVAVGKFRDATGTTSEEASRFVEAFDRVQTAGTDAMDAVNVTINMPVGSNGDEVVRRVKEWERRNGPGWRS